MNISKIKEKLQEALVHIERELKKIKDSDQFKNLADKIQSYQLEEKLKNQYSKLSEIMANLQGEGKLVSKKVALSLASLVTVGVIASSVSFENTPPKKSTAKTSGLTLTRSGGDVFHTSSVAGVSAYFQDGRLNVLTKEMTEPLTFDIDANSRFEVLANGNIVIVEREGYLHEHAKDLLGNTSTAYSRGKVTLLDSQSGSVSVLMTGDTRSREDVPVNLTRFVNGDAGFFLSSKRWGHVDGSTGQYTVKENGRLSKLGLVVRDNVVEKPYRHYESSYSVPISTDTAAIIKGDEDQLLIASKGILILKRDREFNVSVVLHNASGTKELSSVDNKVVRDNWKYTISDDGNQAAWVGKEKSDCEECEILYWYNGSAIQAVFKEDKDAYSLWPWIDDLHFSGGKLYYAYDDELFEAVAGGENLKKVGAFKAVVGTDGDNLSYVTKNNWVRWVSL